MPILLTEPALQGGLGLVAAFIDIPEDDSLADPTVTALGYIRTGNESEIGFGAHSGNAMDGALRYMAALGGGSINLDFYLGDEEKPVSLNNEALFAHVEAQYQLGDSRFFFGPSATWINTTISPNESGAPGYVSQEVTLAALGLSLHYDTRDNRFTPRDGINARVSYERFDESWGSDAEYNTYGAFGAWFHSPNDAWTLSAMADHRAVDGGAPFFVEPSINLRGVPLNRYQGQDVVSAEIEVRR
ncbi:surface antigen-like protein [Aliiruegeria haliotis]|uniref:Surface antigen-like protein n=1 Tax=Aliiruegeria haliotis TaxID=1280846 RepID=A0A2T0RPZ7_9RHOB|nr:BamA/TamA family outer membrane protein [Aliiruegeria haliotis]PRY23180.1 surface antigen-like protein [Aliiruegeria haliotis]